MFLRDHDLLQLNRSWNTNSIPFPHVVIDDFLQDELAYSCYQNLKSYFDTQKNSFVKYEQRWEKKKFTQHKLDLMPILIADLMRFFNSEPFIRILEKVTGLGPLFPDEGLWGGGIHSTFSGGKLDIHSDFTILPTTYGQNPEWQRVLNLIVYLNPSWQPEWKGELEFWDPEMKALKTSITPKFNRAALFYTHGSNHGQPDPYLGPEPEPRFSLATYYYRKVEPGSIEHRSTLYQLRPGEAETAEERNKRLARASPERYATFLKK